MKGDFSRLTFDSKKHYRGVRMQQGRVQLDADWNEQSDLLNYYLETYLKDVLGAGGAPQATAGFNVTLSKESEDTKRDPDNKATFNFHISHGRYYVDGVLCENEQDILFTAQPDYPEATIPSDLKDYAVVYLDVWQRHITALEDPTLRESALAGIDTTTRIQNVWQVKVLPLNAHEIFTDSSKLTAEDIVSLPEWHALVNRYRHKGRLRARSIPHSMELDNQLYRIELHDVHKQEVTFKWSRENGSVAFAIDKLELVGDQEENKLIQCVVTLNDLGRDLAQLQKGDWVELVDEMSELRGRTLPLYQIIDIPDVHNRQVTLAGRFARRLQTLEKHKPTYLLLRRWDHNVALPPAQNIGAVRVHEEQWLNLEKGIQVYFAAGGTYEVGDYWLIPSRTLTDSVEWPSDEHGPLALPPHGKNHHFSPLALLHFHHDHERIVKDLRRIFAPLPVVCKRTESLGAAERRRTNHLFEECISEDDLSIGDLVALVPSTNLQVSKASSDNARLLFGVVSEAIKQDEGYAVRVTIYGRARCKVIGTILAGDLLTISDVAGFASTARLSDELLRQGSIIGKALESYEAEDPNLPGIIDILVALQ
jgi:hypothetical protein